MKFGVIDAKFMNTATTLANDFADMKPQLNQLLKFSQSGFAKRPILARITESNPIHKTEIEFANGTTKDVEVAWEYKWEKVTIKSETTIIPIISNSEGGGHPVDETMNSDIIAEIRGAKNGLAYNIAEMANVELAPIIFGVDMEASAYPSGFIPMPTTIGEYMLLNTFQADDGYFFYTFDRTGIHDGTCAESLDTTAP